MRLQKKGIFPESELNVIELILNDHQEVKEYIEILTDENINKKKMFSVAKDFLEKVNLHSQTEKKVVYSPMEENEELHFNILEAKVEHGIVDKKVKFLQTKLKRARSLSDSLQAELKVLAELVKHHIMEEESEMLPKLQEEVDDDTLSEMGTKFLRLRKLSPDEVKDFSEIKDEFSNWKEFIQQDSDDYMKKMNKFVENLH